MFVVYVINGMVEISLYLLAIGMGLGATAGLIRVYYKSRKGFAGPPGSREPKVLRYWREAGGKRG